MKPRPASRYDYERDPVAIYRRSFATIRAEADLAGLDPDQERVAVRMIHASGDVTLPAELDFHPRLAPATRAALESGAAIFTDAQMIASGISRQRLPAANQISCLLGDPRVPVRAQDWQTTRSAAAVSLWDERLDGSVVAIGNAPTALFQLLELIADGGPRPAAIIGLPVGFVGSAESKHALAANPWDLPYLVLHGRRGGSALCVAAINALARAEEI